MSNGQYNFSDQISAHTLARIEAIKAQFILIAAGFDLGMTAAQITAAIAASETAVTDAYEQAIAEAVIGGAPVLVASIAQLREGTSTAVFVPPERLFSAAESVSLTDGATITPNGNNGFNFHVTLGDNRTLANPSNFKNGQSGRIRVTQDGTGSRTLSYGTAWDFPGGAPTLSTTASAVDVISYYVHSSTQIECSLMKGMA